MEENESQKIPCRRLVPAPTAALTNTRGLWTTPTAPVILAPSTLGATCGRVVTGAVFVIRQMSLQFAKEETDTADWEVGHH